MKTKRKAPCKIKQRGGKKTPRRSNRSCKSRTRVQSGGAMCLTGLCAAGASTLGASKVGAALVSSIGSYKLLSSKSSTKTKKGGRKKIKRYQKFVYSDSNGKDVNFEIKQNNKKITIKNGDKLRHKTYKGLKNASSRYHNKIRECIKKGFDKC